MAQYRHTIEVEARFVDNLTKGAGTAYDKIEDLSDAAKEAAAEIMKLGNKKAEPKVDVDNSNLLRKLNESDNRLKRMAGKKVSTTMLLKDKATEKLSRLASKAKAFSDKVYTAAVNIKDSGAYRTLSKITGAAESLTKKAWRVGVTVVDKATAPLRMIKNALFNIKTLIGAITAGLAANQFIIKPISLADQYSSARIGFQTLLGESAGQQMMNNLDDFAARTPFSTSQVIAQSQRMIAMGWDAESIIKDMETIGDAAAATGKGEQGLGQIVLALSQIKTKGRLSTEELNQLAEAGISAKRYLAEGLGYGTGDEGIAAMTKDLEDGAIGSEKALAALLEGMKEYQGMMDKTANETVTGLKSQIADAFEINVFRKWGQGLQDGAKRGFGTVVELLDKAKSALSELGDMLYDIGKTASNWLADKFQNAVQRILDITDSFEFRNASLKDKIKMLWKGVVVDPLKEWWEGGGQEKTAETAGKIGKWMGETLTKGLLAIFGMTDILKDGGLDAEGGMSVAQSFAKGFADGFDVSAITDKLVQAISNVWGALPTWAKVLLVGYGGGKLALGAMNAFNTIGTFIGSTGTTVGGQVVGASGLLGAIGKTGVYGIGGTGILGGLSKLGYGVSGALGGTAGKAALLGMGGGTAALTGAGAIAMGAGALHIGKSTYDSIKAYKAGDDITGKAEATRAVSTGVGMAAGAGLGVGIAAVGAKVGAAVGTLAGPLGTIAGALIGGGLGTVVGWVAGDKIARNIEAARYESEDMQKVIKDTKASSEEIAEAWQKAKWENLKNHFGDIALSVEEIARLTDQIVWGDDLGNFEQFAAATKNAEANLQSLKDASATTNKWMWKAGLGVKFNDDEKESIVAAFDDYISSAQSYIENKHYEFTTSASLLLDLESEEGKSVLESGNAYYAQIKEQLDGLGSKLSETVNIALEDGVITLDEQAEIMNLQQQIADITSKVADAESQAELELIKVKFGNGNLDIDSFDKFMEQMETTLNERVSTADDAFKVQVANLKMQLNDGAISEEEYNAQLQTLISGYETKVESIQADVMGVELNIIGDAYSQELGSDAVADLQKALQYAIDEGLDPVEISDEKLAELLNVEGLSAETADNIKEMLSGVLGQMELLEVDGQLLLKIGSVETEGDPEEQIKETLPETVNETVGVNISGEKQIQNTIDVLAEDFAIPPEHAATVALLLTGDKQLLNKIDVSQLAAEFGIPEEQAKTIIEKLTGSKSIENRLEVLASDFGVPDSISKTIRINFTAIKGTVQNLVGKVFGKDDGDGKGARGGIWYPRGINTKGYAAGGLVRGGARLVTVAEEGTPEMIIPLGLQRRERGIDLWRKAGEMLGINRYEGGITGGPDENIRGQSYGGGESTMSNSVHVEVGGIEVRIDVNAQGAENVAEVIKAQSDEIAETVAGILVDEIGAQFENTPQKSA